MRLKAPEGGCTVRMYRHGLGDCFLLAFGAGNNRQKYVLIDCGVLLGTKDADQAMKQVAADIDEACGGRLHAVAITHEHWDHVSGFAQAADEFGRIKADELWLAWTEDPTDALARELRRRREAALNGLRLALAGAGGSPSIFSARVDGVMSFFGPQAMLGARVSTDQALDQAKEQWTRHRYCRPGEAPIKLSGLPQVKFYVLGPPADAKMIRKSRPSKKGDQVYLDHMEGGDLGLYLQALGYSPEGPETGGQALSPFDPAFSRERGHPDVAEAVSAYESEDWRSIDTDWMGIAGELALRLDAHTNNTSLVLAIELSPGGKVLLFTGDAQVGNWLSWDQVRWQDEPEELTAADLLARTVLYKVGHHGSHNATLKAQGLERMTSPELAGIIPVDRAMAARKRWRMPHEPLHERLKELTQGRLIISDKGLDAGEDGAVLNKFRERVTENRLYFDLTVPGD